MLVVKPKVSMCVWPGWQRGSTGGAPGPASHNAFHPQWRGVGGGGGGAPVALQSPENLALGQNRTFEEHGSSFIL